MARRIRKRHRTRQRLSSKLTFAIIVLSTSATFLAGGLIYLNLMESRNSKASPTGDEAGGNGLNEILCEFAFEQEPGKATTGLNAVSISSDACIVAGGRASTKGLSPGSKANDINMILNPALFNVDGIDISIDFRRMESTGSIFCRGGSLNFWINRGYPAALYKTYDMNGGYAMVNERSAYEIPDDGKWRTYRFIYNPVNGKGEIFVNGVIVWSHQGQPNCALYWKDAGPVVVGKGMNGNGHNEAIFDNLVVRSTGSVIPPAESLISFVLDTRPNGVQVNWAVSELNKAKSFVIEKSINAIDFIKIGEVGANPDPSNNEYSYFDKTSQTDNVYYYRLKQILKDDRFVNHLPSAIKPRIRTELTIEQLALSPATSTINIAYFIPESGPVRIQITDPSGKVVKSESFEAPVGKNMHVCREIESLEKGTYTVNLIFNNKRVSRKVVKS